MSPAALCTAGQQIAARSGRPPTQQGFADCIRDLVQKEADDPSARCPTDSPDAVPPGDWFTDRLPELQAVADTSGTMRATATMPVATRRTAITAIATMTTDRGLDSRGTEVTAVIAQPSHERPHARPLRGYERAS
jgi:hypothetical protein